MVVLKQSCLILKQVSYMQKTLIKISIIIFIAIIGIVVIYFLAKLLFKKQPAQTEEPRFNIPTVPIVQPTPTPSSKKNVNLVKISDKLVFDFWIAQDTKEIYYLTPEGIVINAKENQDVEISTQIINGLNFIEPSPSNEKALAAFGNPLAPQWGIFDTIDAVWNPLSQEIINVCWGKNDDELIVIVKNAGEFNLARVDLSKVPARYAILIRDFRLKDVKLSFAPPEKLIITEKPSYTYEARVWALDLNPKKLNFYLLFAPEPGLMLNFSKDKETAFRFASPNDFSILNNELKELTPLYFFTLPQKCTANAEAVYCFVPQDTPLDINLPDDYMQKSFYSIDDLFFINTKTDETKKVLISGKSDVLPIDGEKPQYLDGAVYFINRYDGGLYKLAL